MSFFEDVQGLEYELKEFVGRDIGDLLDNMYYWARANNDLYLAIVAEHESKCPAGPLWLCDATLCRLVGEME